MRTRDLGIAIGTRPARAPQRHHRRARRAGRARDAHRGRRAARRRARARPDRRHGRRAARAPSAWREPVFAGCHRLNGNGELTGLEWVRESGLLTTPVAITNTHSVGVVRDALVAASVERSRRPDDVVVAAGRRRDVRRQAQRHQRLPRPAGAPPGGARRGRRRARSPRATSVAGRGWSATSSRAGSGPPPGRPGATAAVTRSASSSRPTTASARGCGSTACRSARRSRSTSVPSPCDEDRRAGERPAAGGSRLDHRRRRDRRAAAAAPVRAPGPAGRPRYRAGRRHRRPHERRPVHRLRDRQPTCRPTTTDEPATVHRTTSGWSATGRHRPAVRRASSRRPRRRSSTRSSPPTTMVGRDGITAHALPARPPARGHGAATGGVRDRASRDRKRARQWRAPE